ncbi:MAG: ParB/RepB/Spo0J family partition protein [Clostridia bacterium]|nr:ParB/RepB/Spo0J family partition protein [Clostridia bacterium]
MSKKKRSNGLGLGIEALFQNNTGHEESEVVTNSVLEVKISDIEPDEGQPRKNFDFEKINELAESIKAHGVIQPLIVRNEGSVYKIIAGERRWRAARIAGLETVPVIERSVTKKEVLEIALIENIQREDLNPIEEAEAFERLIRDFGLTQETLASTVSKSRSDITNSIRLLSLDDEVKAMIASGQLTKGHGKALLGLNPSIDSGKVAKAITEQNLNVRQAESLVSRYNSLKSGAEARKTAQETTGAGTEEYVIAKKDVEAKLKKKIGAKVSLVEKSKNGRGKLQIYYYSADERERIIEMLLGD